ncbi:MAG: His/Gly/Thr/Pro-type tRNA ligase C-terminal domain-containing protein, partial [Nodularia sp. (in: cyanobacteria)]|nr:His/Gly/Thr/Pro-type tRNA ligase C-terminal domain-containing protein [Nodularia sp. (in: cyanobacteria)]
EKRETPGTETIEKVCNFLKCSPTQIVKNVLYKATDDKDWTFLLLVSIRGDQEINEVKLQNEYLKYRPTSENYPRIRDSGKNVLKIELVDTQEQSSLFSQQLPKGYIAPDLSNEYLLPCPRLTKQEIQDVTRLESQLLDKFLNADSIGVQNTDYDVLNVGLSIWDTIFPPDNSEIPSTSETSKLELAQKASLINAYKALQKLLKQYPYPEFLRVVDKTAVELKNFVTGANETGYHVVGANWGEQCKLPETIVDIRKARPGDRAVHNPEQTLQTARGIEVGHIFQLGTKYSQAMSATYTNEQGEENPLFMGCYGVGVSRLAQSAVEQSYDKDGIIWPVAIAPYHAIVTIPNIKDAKQLEVAEKLYTELNKAGVETLLDDRDERAGVKFKDADLIGIPYRIVTGRAINNGKVEIVKRATRETQEIAIEEVVNTLQQWIKSALEA